MGKNPSIWFPLHTSLKILPEHFFVLCKFPMTYPSNMYLQIARPSTSNLPTRDARRTTMIRSYITRDKWKHPKWWKDTRWRNNDFHKSRKQNKTKPTYRVKLNKALDGTWKKQSECCLQCLTKVFKQWAIDSLNAQPLISNYYKILDWYATQNDLI